MTVKLIIIALLISVAAAQRWSRDNDYPESQPRKNAAGRWSLSSEEARSRGHYKNDLEVPVKKPHWQRLYLSMDPQEHRNGEMRINKQRSRDDFTRQREESPEDVHNGIYKHQ